VSTACRFRGPPPAVAPADRRGCLKKALIGCGAVALLVAICFIGLLVYVRQRPDALTDIVMKQVESHYAPDVTAEEKQQLRDAYADFRTALRSTRFNRSRSTGCARRSSAAARRAKSRASRCEA
jgi:hypothetical protein